MAGNDEQRFRRIRHVTSLRRDLGKYTTEVSKLYKDRLAPCDSDVQLRTRSIDEKHPGTEFSDARGGIVAKTAGWEKSKSRGSDVREGPNGFL